MTEQAERGCPRVTVFIPVYNAEAYVGQAIRSVLEQTFTDFELLVIDDCSTDNTLRVCRGFLDDGRLRVETMPANSGRPTVRNEGLRRARGEYIALLDGDDACMPERLARQVAYLDAHPDIDVLGTRWRGMNAQGEWITANRNVWPMSADTVTCFLLFRGIIHNPTVMARRAALVNHAYDPAFDVAEDYDLWARMIGDHRFALLPDRLTAYRLHPTQASSAREEESRRRRCDIQARELARLGVAFDADDVIRHNLLYTGHALFERATGDRLDATFARWARDWLQRLVMANRAAARFPEPAFTRLAARLLYGVCRKAQRHDGIGVWRIYLQSPFTPPLIAGRLNDIGHRLGIRRR